MERRVVESKRSPLILSLKSPSFREKALGLGEHRLEGRVRSLPHIFR